VQQILKDVAHRYHHALIVPMHYRDVLIAMPSNGHAWTSDVAVCCANASSRSALH
jgi:hypothetical protein